MINVFIALLVELEVLPENRGEAIAEKLRYATLPGDYPSAVRLVKKLLEEVEKGI